MTQRITAITGVKILPFLQAKYYSVGKLTEARAIVWHFAEGGGTDTWLTHPTNDNSSHFVLKLDGSLRQMVNLTDAAHSLHVSRPYGPPTTGDFGIFSLDAAKRALGTGILDPNRFIIAIEVEGYQAKGPTTAQRAVIPKIARALEKLFVKAVHLGHRDFQNYKPCPGPSLFKGLLPHGKRLSAIVVPAPVVVTAVTFTQAQVDALLKPLKDDIAARKVTNLAVIQTLKDIITKLS